MRLIDGDALLNILKGLRALANILSGSREKPLIPFDDMVRMIEKSPTIDPVRKGSWVHVRLIYSKISIATCTTCGKRVPVGNFCMDCGSYNSVKTEEGEQE